jgi:predicted ATP-dependent serine protease
MPRCTRCGDRFERRKHQCPSCKQWHFETAVTRTDGLVPLSKVDEAELGDRVRTGEWDRVWGGRKRPGFRRTCVYLLAGGPGAGKSTLMLQTLDPFLAQYPDQPVLYLGNEQEADELKEHAVRLSLKHFDRILVPEVRGGIEYPLTDDLLDCNPCLIIQDSLPGVDGVDLQESLSICTGLKDVAKAHGCPIVVINHINGDGDIAGLMQLQHAVDATFMLRKAGGLMSRSVFRVFEAFKNRTGKEDAMVLEMTDTGLRAHVEDCTCDVCKSELVA